MEMTAEEIRRNYREAKYPQKQVRILADLNGCNVAKIKNILGFKMPAGYTYWDTELEQKLVKLKKARMAWNDIAYEIGVTKCAAKKRYWTIQHREVSQ